MADVTGDPRSTDELLAAAAAEQDVDALIALGEALAVRADERARPCFLAWAEHPDPRVRLVGVQGLAPVAGEPPDAAVVARLVAATRDHRTDIRDWATFGLGRLTSATDPEVAEALVARLSDEDAETRIEAMLALAHRRDERAVAPLAAALAEPDPGTLVVRAAQLLADPRLHPALVSLASCEGATAPPDHARLELIAAASRRCDPAAPAAAERAEGELLAGLLGTMLETGLGTVDATLAGEYPGTEVVVTIGSNEVRAPIWDFDEDDPADPFTYDEAFTRYRLANLARRL